MSTLELKNKLKEQIDNLEHDYLLKELISIIELETEKKTIVTIPEEHKVGLAKSLEQLEEGITESHEDVINELRNGLKR